jgi:dipeptide/tripeptide permease
VSLGQRWQEVRTGFQPAFWVANFTELFERLAYYGPQAVFAIYLHERLGLSSEQTTWLIGYYGFVVWFMPVLGGALADRFGFRNTLAGAFFMLALGNFLLGSLSAPWMQSLREVLPLFALMHLIMLIPAMGPAVVKPVVVGTTARAAQENVRSIGYSIYYTVVNIGAAIGPVFASMVRTRVGAEMVFLVSAALTAAMGIVTLLFYREPARGDEPRVATVSAALANLVKVLRNARFVVFLIIYSGFWVMFWQQYLSLAIYWRDYVNKDTNVDATLSWEALTVILTTLPATYLMRKVRPFTSMVLGVMVSSLSFLLLTLGTDLRLVIAMLVVLAIGEVLQAPRYYEYVSRLAPPGQQGLFMGYAFLPIGIGFLGGGALAGRLLEHYGAPGRTPGHMWYVVSAVGVITTVLLFAYDRLLRPEEA